MIKNRLKKNKLTIFLLAAALLFGTPGDASLKAQSADPSEPVSESTEETAEIPSEIAAELLVDDTEENRTHLRVGVTTPMDGRFFTGLWGRRTTDIDMRILLHAYDLVHWDGELGAFETDPSVVSNLSVMENQAGDRRYILSLASDLFYSDGTRITAWDYAFSILFEISPQVAELGGIPADKGYLLGCAEYLDEENEEVTALAGVRVLADDTLMITVRHEYLPFFYELGLLSCIPYPISVLAPGVVVRDDGEGVYLANEVEDADEDGIPDAPLYTAELLEKTIFDPETGYMNHPSVVSGPYMMASWDGETARLERNPYYKEYAAYRRFVEKQPETAEGEPEETEAEAGTEAETSSGNTPDSETELQTERVAVLDEAAPFIETLTVFYANDNTAVDLLNRGEIDLVNKVTKADTIQQGMLLVQDRERYGEFNWSNYPRNGLSYVSFCCEREELTDAVRQAMAYCMDRDAVVSDYTGGFGLRTDGFYGIGQWMVGLVNGTIAPPIDPPEDENDEEAKADYEARLLAWQELSLDGLNPYSLDVKAAEGLLSSDGWYINKETGLREKRIPLEDETSEETSEAVENLETAEAVETGEDENGRYRILKLELTLAYPENNAIAESLEKNWIPYLEEAGIRLTLLPMDYDELMRLYYDWDDRSETDIDMFYLASNFDVLFDPLVYFFVPEGDTQDKITWSYTNFEDPELYRLAMDMRMTEPEDVLGYEQKWVEVQERFNEKLLILPVYSNVYFDFYNTDLHGYAVSENVAWSSRITDARFYHEEEPADTSEEEHAESESPEEHRESESPEDYPESETPELSGESAGSEENQG